MANASSTTSCDFTDAVPTVPTGSPVAQVNYGRTADAVTPSFASLTLRDEDERYSMNHPSLGGERRGTDIDAEKLEKDFEAIGFTVKRWNDLTAEGMHDLMIKVSEMDLTDHDCFGLAILTHGAEDGSVCGTDKKIEVAKLVAPIQGCKSLVGKPKIFIIQACRGKKLDEGISCDDDVAETRPRPQRLPLHADCLYAYSTVPGYLAWRNSKKGSWFVQALHNMIQKYVFHIDFIKLLTRVNYEVAYEFETAPSEAESGPNTETLSGMKQVPSIESMLTKDLYFSRPLRN